MANRNTTGSLLESKTAGNVIYEYDLFSGSNINILFGDVVVDTAVSITFSREQSKTPVYGYANQYYTFVADGHVIVQGTLLIGFKESGYLLYPIQRFNERVSQIYSSEGDLNQGAWTSPRYTVDQNGRLINSYNPKGDFSLTKASKEARRRQVLEANVEQVLEWRRGELRDDPQAKKRYSQFWRELGALPDDEFEDWAEVFEDAIWYGSDVANPRTREKLFSKNLPQGQSISNEDILSHRNADQYPPIDIWISYGDMSRHPANHTVKKLLDVSFVGQSQTIEISGQPTLESYNFIARNLV